MLRLHTLTTTDYETLRTSHLKRWEADFRWVYIDPALEGIATFGVGLNLRVHGELILERLGFDLSGTTLQGAALAQERDFARQLKAEWDRNYPGYTTAQRTSENNAAKTALDQILQARQTYFSNLAYDPANAVSSEAWAAFTATVAGVSQFRIDDDAVRDDLLTRALDGYTTNNVDGTVKVFSGYEAELDGWLQRTGIWDLTPGLRDRNSKERLALLSLGFNGRTFSKDSSLTLWDDRGLPKTLGLRLPLALREGDRAEVWFQIRYGTNAEMLQGVANRRYSESDLFGLYNHSPNEDDYKAAYRMYVRHRNDVLYGQAGIAGYEARWAPTGTYISIKNALSSAYTYLTQHFITDKGIGVSVAWDHIYVGEDLSTIYFRKTDADSALNGTESNDLLFGESGNDTLNGGAGDDVLYGGKGNDTLKGGLGNDAYVYNPGDGFDTVDDDQGSIRFNSNSPLVGGQRLGLAQGVARSADGRYVYLESGTTLSIIDTQNVQGGITINNFNNGELGITLNDAPAPTNILYGTEGHNTSFFYDTNGDGIDDRDPDVGDLIAVKDVSGNVITQAIYGLGGDDVLDGNGGQGILLHGGQGHDILHADYYLQANTGPGARLLGDTGNDILYGSLKDDYIDGGSENDFAEGRNGNDVIKGDIGSDWLDGQAGNDVIIGSADLPATGTMIINGVPVTYTLPDDDVVLGGAGADHLIGGAGSDRIYGDTQTGATSWNRQTGTETHLYSGNPSFGGRFAAIKDVALVDAGNDDLSGGQGADFLYGGAGNDLIDGGTENDKLEGEGGDDVLTGGDGNDVLWGDSDPATITSDANTLPGDYGYYSYYWRSRDVGADGNDVLDGGAGNDQLIGGAGNDTYLIGASNGKDIITDVAGVDEIRFLQASPVSFVKVGDDLQILLNGGKTNNVTVKNWSADAANQVEKVTFADGTSWDAAKINQKAGNLQVGSAADDTIVVASLDTSDWIQAGEGNDVIDGNSGNDVLEGGAGSDAYVFNLGSGIDVIEDIASTTDLNRVVFGDGITLDSVRLSLGSLVIGYGDQGDEIHITNFDPNNVYGPHAIEYLQFADGTQLTYQQLLDRGFDIAGTGLDDYLTGTNGIDRISGDAGNDEIRGGTGNDLLEGGDGNDSLLGETGNDTLDGGTGNDYLNGSSGSDIYRFALGHGQDTVSDLGGETDRVEFAADVLPTDISVTRYADQLRLTNTATGDRVAIGGWFTGGSAKWQVAFADGTVWDAAAVESRQVVASGTEGDDLIYGTNGDDVLLGAGGNDRLYGYDGGDTLDGGPGNDWLSGGKHSDTYVISRGGGLDVIDASGETYAWWEGGAVITGENRILFGPGISPTDLSVTASMVPWIEGETAFLNIDLGNGDGVEIRGYLYTPDRNIGAYDPLSYPVGLFSFADGQEMPLTDILAMARPASVRQHGTVNNDAITGADQNDGLYGYAGNDTITSGAGDDVLTGGSGNDVLSGGEGNDILIGGWDSDVLDGGAGNDIYIFNPWDRVDRISDSAGTDRVEFEYAISPSHIAVHRSGADLAIKLPSGLAEGTWLLINDGVANNSIEEFFFRQDGAAGTTLTSADILARLTIPAVTGSDANDSLSGTLADEKFYGGLGNDGLYGAGGDDLLSGGDGDDVYGFRRGDGIDTIEETSGSDKVNVLELARADVDMYVKNRGSDLELHIKGTNDTLIVKNWTSGAGAQVESMHFFDDGTVLTLADLNASDVRGSTSADTLRGSAGNDRLYGDAGNDTLLAKGGNDSLDGGAGNDTLQGDAGNDTYLFTSGWGADTISDNDTTTGNADTAAFGSGINPLDLVLSRSGNNLVVSRHGATDSITVQNWYSGSSYQIETLRASEGDTLANTQVDQLIQAMATFSANNGGITWDQALDQRPQDVQAIVASYWQPAA